MKNSVKLGNEKSNVAVCTLWTPLEIVGRSLGSGDYAVMGQLYSKDAGLNAVLRYCLHNKKIRHIVVCGQDRTGSGQALINLKERGIDPERNIIGIPGARVDTEIPVESVERFRQNVDVIDCRGIADYGELGGIIRKLPKKESYGKPESFPEASFDIPQDFPTDSVFKIRSATVGEAWLQALNLVMKFGALKASEHEERQKEIVCMVAVITGEDPDSIAWKDYFTFPKEELDEYYPQVLTDSRISELSYTYGQRLRSQKGKDQVSGMAKKLLAAPHTRRAVAVTWDLELDTDSSNPPCLNLVQALVQGKKLSLLAYLRSNDIYGAWPKNVFALRKLQKNLCLESEKELGELIVISASAHIYERHFRIADEIIRNYPLGENVSVDLPRSAGNLDPRGNIHIELSGGQIRLTHMAPDGKRLESFSAKTAQEASKWLVLGQKISDISHALYLGQELMKAEMALKKNLEYEQDAPLKLK